MTQEICPQQLNRTVKGVAAAIFGMLARSISEPPSNVKGRAPNRWYSPFDNRKLMSHQGYATLRDHASAQLPSFLQVYRSIYVLFRRAQVEPECLVAAVVYIDRFLQATNNEQFRLTSLNWERVVFVAIMLASKTWDDVSCSSKSFSICSNGTINVRQLGVMERRMLEALDYRLIVSADEYRVIFYDLKKFWLNIVFDEKLGEIIPSNPQLVDGLEIPPQWGPLYVFKCSQFTMPSFNLDINPDVDVVAHHTSIVNDVTSAKTYQKEKQLDCDNNYDANQSRCSNININNNEYDNTNLGEEALHKSEEIVYAKHQIAEEGIYSNIRKRRRINPEE
ncbi:MAG: putative Cyclin fold protein [Streblomastix strix]|uniref:Putative Cyclin fold protein n=1 Tax=Streblomastix strix TaxID=222440 RepID=A0A5J4WPL9_9EUKA|nr:MAG: putative Cyclin fold protein [Streblomastix strix]